MNCWKKSEHQSLSMLRGSHANSSKKDAAEISARNEANTVQHPASTMMVNLQDCKQQQSLEK